MTFTPESKHPDPHPLAGKTVRLNLKGEADIKTGDHYVIEDWWDRLGGGSWMWAKGNPACLKYAMRSGFAEDIPTDDEVVYGKVGPLGHLIHVSELGEVIEPCCDRDVDGDGNCDRHKVGVSTV